jgi:NAD(P)H dehydrogenase (quinone)
MTELIEKAALALSKVGEALGIPNLDRESGLIFVTGGKGIVGHRVATRLLRSGYPKVRLGANGPTTLEDENKGGAEIADFNWENTDFDKALVGVKSVLCTAPYVRDWEKYFVPFLNACKKAGVKHVVKLSFYHSRLPGDPFQDVPLVRAHGDCDEALINSGLSYTILAASHLMSNPLTFQGRELRADQKPAVLYGASAGQAVNYVSPNDVAECAVRVLLEPKAHHNKEYTLTGPEAIKDQMVAQFLSDHLKKPIMFVDQPLHTFEEAERMSGDPEWLVEDLVALEKVKASGFEENPDFVTDHIKKICGHNAENFESYLRMVEYMTDIEV